MPRLSGSVARCLAATTLLAACEPAPVQWSQATQADTTGLAAMMSGDAAIAPPGSSGCTGSLANSRARGITYAVWWSPRPDSTALLLSARSANGRDWSTAPVDTTDVGRIGCRRPAPAIAADSASGYVHVTYAMVAPEGPGVFFSHSMDGGATFHSPVPIVYGERLGRTSVAADGDRVAVAFEDPNSGTPRIGLALSRTMGHIFEERILPVTEEHGAAMQPFVALRGRAITIAWQQQAGSAGATARRVRSGILQ